MDKGIAFFTATCLNWQILLEPGDRKDIFELRNRWKLVVGDNTDQVEFNNYLLPSMGKLKKDILLFIACIVAGGLIPLILFGADYYLKDYQEVQLHDTYFFFNTFEFTLVPVSLSLFSVFAIRVFITKFKNKLAIALFVLGVIGIALSAIEIFELVDALRNKTFDPDE